MCQVDKKIRFSESPVLRPSDKGHEAIKNESGVDVQNYCTNTQCANSGKCNKGSKSNLTSFYAKGWE